jgi:hypothetical protein
MNIEISIKKMKAPQKMLSLSRFLKFRHLFHEVKRFQGKQNRLELKQRAKKWPHYENLY